jgi:hypothetical protein
MLLGYSRPSRYHETNVIIYLLFNYSTKLNLKYSNYATLVVLLTSYKPQQTGPLFYRGDRLFLETIEENSQQETVLNFNALCLISKCLCITIDSA